VSAAGQSKLGSAPRADLKGDRGHLLVQQIVEEPIKHREVTAELSLPEFGLAGENLIVDAHTLIVRLFVDSMRLGLRQLLPHTREGIGFLEDSPSL